MFPRVFRKAALVCDYQMPSCCHVTYHCVNIFPVESGFARVGGVFGKHLLVWVVRKAAEIMLAIMCNCAPPRTFEVRSVPRCLIKTTHQSYMYNSKSNDRALLTVGSTIRAVLAPVDVFDIDATSPKHEPIICKKKFNTDMSEHS